MSKKHEFVLGTLNGRKVGLRHRQIIYRAEARKLIAGLDETIGRRTGEIATLRADAANESLSPLGAGVLGRVADNFENQNGPAAEVRDSLALIADRLDDAPEE